MPLRVSLFGGIIPRIADRGLPDNAAQFAMNAKLFSGELRAWNNIKFLSSLPISGAKTVYHYRNAGADLYAAFDKYTNITKSALINDSHNRIYYSNVDGVFVTTTARMAASLPPFKLGVPKPTGSLFTVTPAGGTAATAESRVYVATLRTSYGEESEPTGPVLASGNADGTWTVNGLNAMLIDTAGYPNITHMRLYRTLTSATGVDYRLINEWGIGARPASYLDNVTNVTLASQPVLESLSWTLPPAGLSGLISVAGGFLAGFVGSTVRLSMPYQPHAWPEDYQFAVDDKIVGLGTFGNTIVVCTEGRPQLLIGPAPDVMSLAKLESVQPCLSARSIVSTSSGVLFASTDGLVVVDGSTNKGQIISRNWVTKDEWMANFSPKDQMSSIYQDRYLSFYSSQLGFCIGFDDAVTGFTELQQDGISSVDLDVYTGQTLVTVGTSVFEWDGDTTSSLIYAWRSKPFLQSKPVNYGVIQLRGSFVGNSAEIPVPDPVAPGGWAINTQPLGGSKSPTLFGGEINGPDTWQMAGVAPAPPSAGPTIATKVYADGALVWIGSIGSEDPVRLPSGFKAVLWEIEVQGVSPLFSITLAETGKMLEHMP